MSGESSESRHICIVLLTGLGDVVHGLPLVNAIKDAKKDVRITWIAEPMPASFLEGHPSIDQVVTFRRRDGLRGIRQLRHDFKAVPPVDVTLNLNVYLKSIWPTLLSRAPRRIGFDRGRSFEGVWLASNEKLNSRPRAHTADMFLEFADRLRIPVPSPEWRIRFTSAERAAQDAFFSEMKGRPVATIVPATATIKKDWLADRWARIAEALERDYGFAVVIAGGPGAREQAVGREIMARSAASITWAMSDSVRRLSYLIDGSDLLIAPDTGPVHIARALDVPVIGLYGHTNPWRVGPWRAFQDLWVDRYTEPGTAPDPSNRTPKWDRMPTITVEDVIGRIDHAVTKYDAGRKARRG